MIYITLLIYIQEGQEAIFDEFESIAIPSINRYNGKLLLRIRPDTNSVIESSIDKPYEIHFVEFNSELDFEYFKLDPIRNQFLHLRNTSIRSTMMVKGELI